MAKITTVLPTDWEAPQRGVDSQSVFRVKANDAWVKLRNDITPKVNQWSTEANAVRDEVNALNNQVTTNVNLSATYLSQTKTAKDETIAFKNASETVYNNTVTLLQNVDISGTSGYTIAATDNLFDDRELEDFINFN